MLILMHLWLVSSVVDVAVAAASPCTCVAPFMSVPVQSRDHVSNPFRDKGAKPASSAACGHADRIGGLLAIAWRHDPTDSQGLTSCAVWGVFVLCFALLNPNTLLCLEPLHCRLTWVTSLMMAQTWPLWWLASRLHAALQSR